MLNITIPKSREITTVKRICDLLRYGNYQQSIPPRTWTKYKSICKVTPNSRIINDDQALLLCCISKFKAVFPKAKVTLEGVKSYLENNYEANKQFVSLLDNYGEFSGVNLRQLIYLKTGKMVAESTLYYWSKVSNRQLIYCRTKVYSGEELNNWCNFALKHQT